MTGLICYLCARFFNDPQITGSDRSVAASRKKSRRMLAAWSRFGRFCREATTQWSPNGSPLRKVTTQWCRLGVTGTEGRPLGGRASVTTTQGRPLSGGFSEEGCRRVTTEWMFFGGGCGS